MAKSKLVKVNEKIEEKVIGTYKKIEDTVVGGETVEEAKERLKQEHKK